MNTQNKTCNCGYEKGNGHSPECPLYVEEKWLDTHPKKCNSKECKLYGEHTHKRPSQQSTEQEWEARERLGEPPFDKQSTDSWEKEFDKLVKDTTGDDDKVFFPYGGDNHDFAPDNMKRFIKSLLTKAKQEERESWINQPANQHDERIRQETKKAILDVIKQEEERFRCAACDGAKCEHTLSCLALSDIQQKIKELD